MNNKQLKTENCQLKLFLQIKSEAKAIEISVLCCSPFEKFNVLLKCLLPYTYLIICLKYIGSGIQTTVHANELSSVMAVY